LTHTVVRRGTPLSVTSRPFGLRQRRHPRRLVWYAFKYASATVNNTNNSMHHS